MYSHRTCTFYFFLVHNTLCTEINLCLNYLIIRVTNDSKTCTRTDKAAIAGVALTAAGATLAAHFVAHLELVLTVTLQVAISHTPKLATCTSCLHIKDGRQVYTSALEVHH